MTLSIGGKRRIAFILDPETWLGGVNYFRNLIQALAILPDPKTLPIIFTGESNAKLLEGFPSTSAVRTRAMDRGTFPWWSRKLVGKVLAGDWFLDRLLRGHDIDLISHRAPLTTFSSIPAVGWIPDFQHVHLPELFSAQELRARDREFMRMCEECAKVIVSSECALSDLRAFSPRHAAKGEVLHFVANPANGAAATPTPQLRQSFDLPEHYFLLPNQFWVHKNHRVVITALKVLKQRDKRAVVLATGSTRDHRQPGHFDSLLNYAQECGVLDRFRVLGIVPFADLSGLMRDAVALINPSLFEGWSTSVEEAKSLGKRMLLSDIPVHREQAPELGGYFSPDDASGLADLMQRSLVEFDPQSDEDAREKARTQLSGRQVEFARAYERIVTPRLFGVTGH